MDFLFAEFKIQIKKEVSANLALRDSADSFFDMLEHLKESSIIVDFNDVDSISRSFAHQYHLRKKDSSKNITEINQSENIKKMLKVVENPRKERKNVFDIEMIKPISL